jgi:hypothetical protein
VRFWRVGYTGCAIHTAYVVVGMATHAAHGVGGHTLLGLRCRVQRATAPRSIRTHFPSSCRSTVRMLTILWSAHVLCALAQHISQH